MKKETAKTDEMFDRVATEEEKNNVRKRLASIGFIFACEMSKDLKSDAVRKYNCTQNLDVVQRAFDDIAEVVAYLHNADVDLWVLNAITAVIDVIKPTHYIPFDFGNMLKGILNGTVKENKLHRVKRG